MPLQFAPASSRNLLAMRALLCVAMLAIGWAADASAMSLREWRALAKSDAKQGPHYAQYYLVGVMEGMLEAQAQALRTGAKPAICLNDRRLEPAMAQSLFATELQRNAAIYEADMPVQLVMRNALETVFACSD